jgi:flagellar motor protein MotB
MYFSIDPPQKSNKTLTSSLMVALEKIDQDVSIERSKNKSSPQMRDNQAPAIAEQEQAKAHDLAAGNAMVERTQAAEDRSDKRDAKDKLQIEADTQGAMQMIMEIVLPKEWMKKLNKRQMSAKAMGNEPLDAYVSSVHAPVSDKRPEGTPTGSSTTAAKASGDRPDITEIKALDAEASRIGDRVYIMFPRVSFFDSASTEITPEGRRAIEKFAQVYLPFSGKALLNIVGFADERPVTQQYRFRDNLELSVLRAVSAQRVAERVGIPLSRTRLMGHGINSMVIEPEVQ